MKRIIVLCCISLALLLPQAARACTTAIVTRGASADGSVVGTLIKRHASVAGADVGCQGEIGSASSMAAAMLAQVMGETPDVVENAAEFALEHHLGMTCDPVGGYVQIPCISRNAMSSVKSWNAWMMARTGQGTKHPVGLDLCIHTMNQTGRDMKDDYRETARGGLALFYTQGC